MTSLIVFGAGKIGLAIHRLLEDTGDYQVTLADHNQAALELAQKLGAKTHKVDALDKKALAVALKGQQMLINAGPYFVGVPIAEAALAAGVHYFDLTEDVATTQTIRKLAKNAKTAFIPQCGLAPGFISIVAADLCRSFDSLERVRLRVGALPQYPSNQLKYNLTWSTDGLINEYCNPCEAIYQGEFREVLPLEGYEQFSLDGIQYEAFNTSGGLGSLGDSLSGKLEYLDYKTVRYPGHCQLMKLLLEELNLANRRDLLKDILEASIPMTLQDVVLVFVTVSGYQEGRLTQKTYSKKIYDTEISGRRWSAIQRTTAAGVCAVVDLFRDQALPQQGLVCQEDVSLDKFLANRIGKHYA